MNTKRISVIVPTYNRLDSLKQQINALLSQNMPTNDYEIIIINDGSTDGTREYLDQVTQFYPELIALHQTNGGPARARNTALRIAKGNIVAFTDDDCIADSNWLKVIDENWCDTIVGLQGATYTDRENITPLTHQIDNESGHNSVPTCNAAYLRSTLLNAGGFDESFPYAHNEDADLSWRMQQFGEVKFCSEMRVYHPPRKDSFRKVARRMKILESEFTLFMKSPESYRKYRGKSPLNHIYGQVFFRNLGYHFLSRIKLWNKPKFLIQGMTLSLCWWFDLLVKLPRFLRLTFTARH